MRRVWSGLLAVILLLSLTACAGTAQAEGAEHASPTHLSAAGRYVETNITPQSFRDMGADYGMLQNLYTWEDGALDLIVWACWFTAEDHSKAEGRYLWYHSDDRGGTWEERPLPDEVVDGKSCFAFLLDQEGNFYALVWPEESEDTDRYTELIVRCWPAEGADWAFSVDLTEGIEVTSETYISCEPLLYQQQYLILKLFRASDSYENKIWAFDLADGALAWQYEGERSKQIMQAAIAGDSIYLQQETSHILSAATGEETGSFETNKLLAGLDHAQVTEDSVYYYVGDDLSICRGIFGETLEEVILERDEYQYGAEAEEVNGFGVLGDGTIYLNAGSNTDVLNLYRYDYAEEGDLSAEILTIWTLGSSDTLRQTAAKFREAHPEVTVRVQSQDEQDRNDAITTLNTQLLAGEGPDVLILDGTSYESYLEKGVLADLTELYEGTNFVGETVSALLGEGGCCIIPARFTVPVLYGDNLEGGADLTAFASAVGAAEDTPYVSGNFWNMERLLWASSSSAMVDEGGMDEENLRLWLQTLKEISDACGYFAEREETEEGVAGESVGPGEFGYQNQNVCVDASAYDWMDGSALAGVVQLDAIEGPVQILKRYQERWGGSPQAFQMVSFPGLAQGAYTPRILMAVSAASVRQDLAKEFVETALSLEVQQYTYGDGLPVLQAALDQQLDYFTPYAAEYGWDMEELRAILESRTTPAVLDETVSDAIETAAEAYCRGEQTLEETVSAIRTSLALKLAEQ